MSAETELYAALSSAAGLAALVADRIYPDGIPQDQGMPAVVFSRKETEPIYSLGSELLGERAVLMVGSWAESRTQAEPVADQVRLALAAAGVPFSNRGSGFDPDVGAHAVTISCDWWT